MGNTGGEEREEGNNVIFIYYINYTLIKKNKLKKYMYRLRYDLSVKNTSCFSRNPGFNS